MLIDPLAAEKLYRVADLSELDFSSTNDLDDVDTLIGQDRALEAIQFGAMMKQRGYNFFVIGPKASGKHTAVSAYLKDHAKHLPSPSDWIYVHNFEDTYQPQAIEIETGRANVLARDMRNAVTELKATAPALFETDEHRAALEAIQQSFVDKQEAMFREVAEEAGKHGLIVAKTQAGLTPIPVKDGKPMEAEEIEALPEEERNRLVAAAEEIRDRLKEGLRQMPTWERERQTDLRALKQDKAANLIDATFASLIKDFGDSKAVSDYLSAVKTDIVENIDSFLPQPPAPEVPGMPAMPRNGAGEVSRKYEINVLVSNTTSSGAPVILEDKPALGRLIGKIEHRAQMGAMLTDHTLIKPGALHRANGGYILINAGKLLSEPFSWNALKAALYSQSIDIEAPGENTTTVAAVSIQPQRIPLNVKVVLFGDQMTFHYLSGADTDFGDLFKVAAEFDEVIDRDDAGRLLYARLIATIARRNELMPFNRDGVGRVIEHCSRIVADAEKLTARVGLIADLMRESDFWARGAGKSQADGDDVSKALAAQRRRSDRMRLRSIESVTRETIKISTDGEKVGQVNGLSVLSLGAWTFGKPSRITARTRMGRGRLVDIEREVALGGPLHSKGVLILTGFLSATFALDHPISLSASLVFEQSYGGVDGDSASSTELYALLSALSGTPISQGFAVTGSVNQMGEVQAIGGVNEKIEGFFDICEARGLTGDQGVLIPSANTANLMLRDDIVEASKAGQFHIYPIETIDQGIEVLTGIPAGARTEDGWFPMDTIYRRVEDRLIDYAEKWRAYQDPKS